MNLKDIKSLAKEIVAETYLPPTLNKKKKVKEATGDQNFDGMMGKITGSTSPHNFNADKLTKVQAMGENPTRETILALNKMMRDMQVTMRTANELMNKLMNDR